MVSQVVQNTFVSTYKDDFRDSDNYHRILFNTGRALQARELTQLQTIIQKEVERFGRYVFNEGSLITDNSGVVQSRQDASFFLKLDTSTNALPTDYASLEGTYVTNNIANPVKAYILKVIPATGGDPATLIVSYVDGGDNTAADTNSPLTFSAGQDLTTTSGTLTIQTVDTVLNPATGRSSLVTVPQNEVFVNGHFVFTPKQSIVLSKYSSTYTGVLGYKVTENIVTVSDDVALYDNAGSTPNLTSPGADRYRITLTLELEENITNETFIKILKFRNGQVETVQNKDNVLNRLGDVLNNRTSEINGTFIVNDRERFRLQVLDDSDDDYLIYNIGPGVAYVDGVRISTEQNTRFRAKKARTTAGNLDIERITGLNAVADYGNYYLADSMYGMLGLIDSLGDFGIYNAANLGGTKIAEARIRSITKSGEKYKLHVFDLARDSNGSGTLYNLDSAKSLGIGSANYANLTLDATTNQAVIKDLNNNGVVFNLPRKYPYTLSSANFTVGDIFTATTDGSGLGTFNVATAGEEFTDITDWLLAYDSDGVIVDTVTVDSGGAGTESVRLSGLVANKDVTLFAYVNVNDTFISKSLVTGATTSVSLSGGKYSIPNAEVYTINSITDDTTSENITYKFTTELSRSQKYKDLSTVYLKTGYSAPAGTITINYDYFTNGATGSFYSVNSYSGVDYKFIPTLLQTGMNLRNAIDFRPKKDNTGQNFTGTGSEILRIPRDGDLINFTTADFYRPAADIIYMDPYERRIKVKRISETDFNIGDDMVPLHAVSLGPYTFNKNDMQKTKFEYKAYKMQDITRLDRRISNLEEVVTLTLTEQSIADLAVTDENGNIRTKLGLTADGFKNHNQSLTALNPSYKASLDISRGELRPRQIRRAVPLFYDSDKSVGVKRYQNTIWPKFTEEVLIEQTIASGPSDVNQEFLSRFTGNMTLNPDYDNWIQRRTIDGGSTSVVFRDGDLSTYDKFEEYGR